MMIAAARLLSVFVLPSLIGGFAIPPASGHPMSSHRNVATGDAPSLSWPGSVARNAVLSLLNNLQDGLIQYSDAWQRRQMHLAHWG